MAESTDILMRIKKDGNFLGVPGETGAEIDKQDELTKDFTPGKFIEIQDFDFGMNLVDRDSKIDSKKPGSENHSSDGGKFSRFMSMDGDVSGYYRVTFDDVSITRQMDSSTPVLFSSCFGSRSLQQITVVKRKAAGGGSRLGNIPYLRVDFDTVLITDIGWEIGETVMKEKFKFVFRKITMKYRPQNPDGSPGAVLTAGPLSLLKTAAASG